jgi:single-strand DNA-binding protein
MEQQVSYNKATLLGRLGGDPELRYTADGKAITKFTLAVDSGYGDRKRTDWLPIVAFGKTAEVAAQYLQKGRQVLIDGQLRVSSWEKDGTKHWKTEVIVDRLVFVGEGRKSDDVHPAEREDRHPAEREDYHDSADIPFE